MLAERMARENVEAFKRAVDAGNRGDLEALLKKLDPEVESHPPLNVLLGGEAAVYRGDLIAAIGSIRACGTNSGVEIELSWAYLVQFRGARRS
jgi:hypothetical protein